MYTYRHTCISASYVHACPLSDRADCHDGITTRPGTATSHRHDVDACMHIRTHIRTCVHAYAYRTYMRTCVHAYAYTYVIHACACTQVGYGDFSPSSSLSQLFTIVYAPLGAIIIVQASITLVEPSISWLNRMTDHMTPALGPVPPPSPPPPPPPPSPPSSASALTKVSAAASAVFLAFLAFWRTRNTNHRAAAAGKKKSEKEEKHFADEAAVSV